MSNNIKQMENMRKKIDWLEKKDNDKLIELWNEFMNETLDPYNVFEMDDFDEAMSDLTPKEIMQFSNGHFNPNHQYYGYDENITGYISFDDITSISLFFKSITDTSPRFLRI